MKSTHLIVMIIAFSGLIACKGSKNLVDTSISEAEALANVPIITYVQDTIHLGRMIEGEKKRITYNFTNTGKENLVIDLATACRCTDLSWPQEPIEPGKSGEIVVEFDSTGFTGEVIKTIDVIANTDPIVKEAWFTAYVAKK